MNDTANRGKGPICSCGIGELSLPAAEGEAEPPKENAGPGKDGESGRPDREGDPADERNEP